MYKEPADLSNLEAASMPGEESYMDTTLFQRVICRQNEGRFLRHRMKAYRGICINGNRRLTGQLIVLQVSLHHLHPMVSQLHSIFLTVFT